MANIITARQAFKANGGADIANCSTLAHILVPYGKQSTLIDYKAGVHKTGYFSSHSDAYSVPGTVTPGTALTGGEWVDLGTANFIALLVANWNNALLNVQIGDSATNGKLVWSGSGEVVGAGGAASLGYTTNTGVVSGRALIRESAAATRLEVDGITRASSAVDVGAVTLDDDFGHVLLSAFYGLLIFKFSGDLPSNYSTVISEISENLQAGVYRLPPEIEDWT